MKVHIPRFFSLIFILFLVACAAPTPIQTLTPAPTPTSTPIPTRMPTPLPIPTETPPAKPANAHDLTVYNYETKKDEVISPVFDKDMNTWVWKNTSGEIRRFLDLETGHVFAQTEETSNRLIYQIDSYFSWEADLSDFDKQYPVSKGYTPTGLQYLVDVREHYSGIIVPGDPQTTITFKIVHGGYDDIAEKSRISQTSMKGDKRYEQPFLWPIYNVKNNTYVLTTYMVSEYTKNDHDEIIELTEFLLNYCPTSNFVPYNKTVIRAVGIGIPKKPI